LWVPAAVPYCQDLLPLCILQHSLLCSCLVSLVILLIPWVTYTLLPFLSLHLPLERCLFQAACSFFSFTISCYMYIP
jgi:hypothetical protein